MVEAPPEKRPWMHHSLRLAFNFTINLQYNTWKFHFWTWMCKSFTFFTSALRKKKKKSTYNRDTYLHTHTHTYFPVVGVSDTPTTGKYKYWLGGILSANICSRDAATLTTVWEKHCCVHHSAPHSFKHNGPVVYSTAGSREKRRYINSHLSECTFQNLSLKPYYY